MRFLPFLFSSPLLFLYAFLFDFYTQISRIMKKQKFIEATNHFDLISDEIMFMILDLLSSNPIDLKSFSLTCKSFYTVESNHRKILKSLRSEHLPSVLKRYTQLTHLDFSLSPRVTDASLAIISKACNSKLRSIDLSRSKLFSATGLLSLATSCVNLVEIDLSNATELRDAAAVALAKAKNLEKLWLGRCKLITDMGIGCIAVGCTKLRFISLKWCMSIGDLGVGLIAVKCEQIRSMDLSYVPVNFRLFFCLFYVCALNWFFFSNFTCEVSSKKKLTME